MKQRIPKNKSHFKQLKLLLKQDHYLPNQGMYDYLNLNLKTTI